MEFNVRRIGGGTMLLNWVSRDEAIRWLMYYRRSYGRGVPYPNGKGTYDMQFTLATRRRRA